MQCIVNDALKVRPPGPLLSWARLDVHDLLRGERGCVLLGFRVPFFFIKTSMEFSAKLKKYSNDIGCTFYNNICMVKD